MKIKFIAILILFSLLFKNPIHVSAGADGQSGVPRPDAFRQAGENEANVTFGELGFQETSLVSPFDSTRVLFSIPANWRLVPNGQITLDYEIILTGADAGLVGTERNPYGGR